MSTPFGFELGGSHSNSKTTQSSTGTFNNTTTPIIPSWIEGPVQSTVGRIGGLLNLDPNSLVAPAHPLQQQAAAMVGRLDGTPWAYEAANNAMASAAGPGWDPYAAQTYGGATVGPVANAGAASVLDNLGSYMSPYRQQVVDSALADFDHGAGQTRAQLDLDLAGAGAFGGSGAALSKSMTEEGLVRGRATTSANLLDQMFNRGAELANLDADRRTQVSLANSGAANTATLNQAQLYQQAGLAGADARNAASQFNANLNEQALRRRIEAAQGIGNLADAYSENQRANIAALAGLGQTFRGIDQDQRQAPITSTQQIVAMLSGLPLNLFVGQNEQGVKSENSVSNTRETQVKAGVSFP